MRSYISSSRIVLASALFLAYLAVRCVQVQIGYTPASHRTEPWFSNVARVREQLYAEMPRNPVKPTIYVVAGSNGLYGINSQLIASRTGLNVRNYSLHGSLHLDLLFSQVIDKVGREDIVVAPVEWEVRDRKLGSQFDTDNYLHHFWTSSSPSLSMLYTIYTSVPLSRYWSGLVAYIYGRAYALPYQKLYSLAALKAVLIEGPLGEGFTYTHRSLNETGDFNIEWPMTRETWATGTDFSVPDTVSASGLATMDYWQAAFAGRGARLMVVPPIMLENSGGTITSITTWRNIERMRALMGTSKSPLHCDPIGVTFSSIYRFDTVYHPNAEGARLRSAELADCIAGLIDGSDVRTRPIDPATAVVEVEARLRRQRHNFGSGTLPFQTRLRNLTAIRSALDSRHAITGTYPLSSAGADWNTLLDLQANLGFNLSPEPESRDRKSRHHYAYISDGRGYKIAVFGASEDCTVVAANWPEMIDPARIKAGDPTDCAAYGYWTRDFANK
ncbi:MAG: hypothetical protein QOH32_1628 [Bradyrhizobium sp.]|jgi:hypothetical protein|nr:hypothetical protein [Bradyrhizobium sp.]